MTSLIDHITDRMSTSTADDIRELNDRIAATEAFLAGLRRAREDLLSFAERRVLDREAARMDPVLEASVLDTIHEHRMEAGLAGALAARLEEDESEPGRDYAE